MQIKRIQLDQVVVPARPDSVNSAELDRPLHQLSYGGRRGFATQFDSMPKTIIRLHVGNGIVGLGETYRGLSFEQLVPVAESLLGQDLRRLNVQDLPISEGRLYDGFECAVLDTLGKSTGMPLCLLLGGAYRAKVECSYWTGHRTTADAARKAREGMEGGFRCIKFKCDLDDPVVEWCRAIREACGPEFRVILDPNRRWQNSANTLERVRLLEEIGNVLCVEDPLPRWDFDAYARLRGKSNVPVAIHISLPYMEMGQMATDVVQVIRASACDFLNLNGGCFPVIRLATAARLADLPFWHGSEVDLGILEASYVHKAAACANCTLPSDIFGRLVREHDLLKEPLRFDGRFVEVPQGPGLGIELDDSVLRQYMTSSCEVSL